MLAASPGRVAAVHFFWYEISKRPLITSFKEIHLGQIHYDLVISKFLSHRPRLRQGGLGHFNHVAHVAAFWTSQMCLGCDFVCCRIILALSPLCSSSGTRVQNGIRTTQSIVHCMQERSCSKQPSQTNGSRWRQPLCVHDSLVQPQGQSRWCQGPMA